MEAPPGFEPGNGGFANLSLNHLGMAPNHVSRLYPSALARQASMEARLLSLVVITRNEADRLGDCLASVPFASESIVLDSGSTDRTVEVALSHGAQVIETDWPGHVVQKNRALGLASMPWVLSLDADERLCPTAAAALQSALQAPGECAAFKFSRLSSWLGHPIRHGRWYPDRKVRVVRRGKGRWHGPDPHDHLVVDGTTRTLDGDILHDPYRSLDEHLQTIARYSKVSADGLRSRGREATWLDVAARPPLHFVDSYLLRRGFMDGLPGLAVAGLGATHVLCKWSRLRFGDGP